MNYEERDVAMSRKVEATYYQERLNEAQEKNRRDDQLKKIVTPDEMPWEICPQGTIKHLVNKKMGTRTNTVDIYMQVIQGDSRSGKHRHMAEEYMFILEGKGYSLHWDVDMELGEQYYWKVQETPSKWEWEQGDSVYIPPNTIHQHFNADPDNPVRFIGAESRIMADMGLDDLEQLENAPEYNTD
jgi:quercetin dioxygenase-like cupin family protein